MLTSFILLAVLEFAISFKSVRLSNSISRFLRMSNLDNNSESELSSVSKRLQNTESPYIENILDKYSGFQNLLPLALGSIYWKPPTLALDRLKDELYATDTHRYNNILGYTPLVQNIKNLIGNQSIDMSGMEVAVTAGANQAIANVALSLCDAGDNAIVIAPYYFSHRLALQLAQVNVLTCPFNPSNLQPQWSVLEEMIYTHKPKLLVITTPNNPSGYVWSEEELTRLINLCKSTNTWLVADQTYFEFIYDNGKDNETNHTKKHIFPCGAKYNYEKIIHIFSLSKVFGMPGWRVGYLVFPKFLTESMRKIQDTVPTHACVLSQKLASYCIEQSYAKDPVTQGINYAENLFLKDYLQELSKVREVLIPILKPLNTVITEGAFYFLVPLPPMIDDEEAVDILVKEFQLLLMPGSCFGAKNHLRLSYGSIAPHEIISSGAKIQSAFTYLRELSNKRVQEQQSK